MVMHLDYLDLYRVYHDRYPLESLKQILIDLRNTTNYSLQLKKHYNSDSIIAIIQNDTDYDVLHYQYKSSVLRYITSTRYTLETVKKYLSLKLLFTGPLHPTDIDTLEYYRIYDTLLF